MSSNSRSFEFTAAIRGYHVFQKIWKPEYGEILCCSHENGNEFDMFSVKACRIEDRKTVGHIPREISRPTKFLLHRGANMKVTLTGSHYRKSPLFQGGLEIPCKITVTMPGTIRNHLLLDRYRELVNDLYCEPKEEIILGNFLTPNEEQEPLPPPKRKKKVTPPPKPDITVRSNDIRTLFRQQEERNKSSNEAEKITIILD